VDRSIIASRFVSSTLRHKNGFAEQLYCFVVLIATKQLDSRFWDPMAVPYLVIAGEGGRHGARPGLFHRSGG
jgi:hypothetical protein